MMKKLTIALIAIGMTITSCGTDDDPGYEQQRNQTCRSNAMAGLEKQYETPAELDALLDVICGPQVSDHG